jgi:hypothetical protein
MIESTFSMPPTAFRGLLAPIPEVDRLFCSVDNDPVEPPAPDNERLVACDNKAASPPWESTIVVIQEFSGSGGSLTRVMIPGTTSEKCLETNVEMREDFPTPSA